MSGQQDTRTCEELLAALQAEREAREAAEAALQAEREAAVAENARRDAQVWERRALALREQLRRELPRALVWAVWESRRYHRSVLTGRCLP